MRSASRSLSGNQAKKVVFNGSPSEYVGPQSAKPGLFSAGEPASAFEGSTGVVAGTVLRRWNGNGGGRRWGPGVQSASGAVSLKEVSVPVHPGETDSGGFLLKSSAGACGAENFPVAETESGGAQFVFPVAETESGGALEFPAAENDLGGAQFCGAAIGPFGPDARRVGSFGHVVDGGVRHPTRVAPRARSVGVKMDGVGHRQGQHDVLDTTLGRAGGTGRRAMRGLRGARGQRAEAGSLDSFGNDAFFSCRIESPSSRVARVTSALHNLCPDHSSLIPAHNSHARMPHARCVVNSVGDTEDGGRLSCVYGGTKSLSTCTRTGVRRPAVEKLASPQQASLKLHDETWAGLLKNQGPRIFREVEIIPGCAVRVACPSCPDYYPEPPGPGIVIRNMLGWSKLEKTERSGVFRGALQGEKLFSLLDAAGDWERKGSYHTAWAVPM